MSATHFDEASVLAGLELNDAYAIRRFMNAVFEHIRLGSSVTSTSTKLNLKDIEAFALSNVATLMQSNKFLEKLMMRFASYRYEKSFRVIEAANFLVEFATLDIQMPAEVEQEAYNAAKQAVKLQLSYGVFPYMKKGDEVDGFIEPDFVSNVKPDFCAINKKEKLRISYTPESEAQGNHGEVASSSDYNGDDDSNYAEAMDNGESSRSQEEVVPSKHTPKLERGARYVPNQAVDRSTAKLGKVEPHKLVTILQTEKPNPRHAGRWIPSTPVTFTFAKEMDWNDKACIQRLNSWRYQFLDRALPDGKRDTRPQWMVSERDALYHILQSNLAKPEVGGRFSQIQWEVVATKLYEAFEGLTHPAGSWAAATDESVARSKKKTASKKTSNPKKRKATIEDSENEDSDEGGAVDLNYGRKVNRAQVAVKRTTVAIQAKLPKFACPHMKQLIRDAKQADLDHFIVLGNASQASGAELADVEGPPRKKIKLSTEGKGKAIENADDGDDLADEYLAVESPTSVGSPATETNNNDDDDAEMMQAAATLLAMRSWF